MKSTFITIFAVLIVQPALADNWPQFRGPVGRGISAEKELPTEWSETKNVIWKSDLPGRGSSSPIVWGKRVFITAYTGYGLSRKAPGDLRCRLGSPIRRKRTGAAKQ